MAKRILNIVFITLIVLTLAVLIFDFVSFVLAYKQNDDMKILVPLAMFGYPFLAILIVGNELFLWRSLVFIVSYPGHKKIELVANILIAAAAAASFVYMGYVIAINQSADWVQFMLFALGFQIVCKIFTWVVGTIAICRGKE